MRYLLAVILLSGCASGEWRAERDIARHGPYCDRMGYVSGTDAWRNCVAQAAQAQKARAATVISH
jgi:hypothetical protein